MFNTGLGWTEIIVIAVIALVIVGPKDLPKMMKYIFQLIGKAKAMLRDMQSSLSDAVKNTEFDEVKQMADEMRDFSSGRSLSSYVDPDGKIENDMRNTALELKTAQSAADNFSGHTDDLGTEPSRHVKPNSNPLLAEAEAYSQALDAQKN